MFSSQEIASSLVSFQLIFEALQSEIKKIPEFNPDMIMRTVDSQSG